MGEEVNLLFLSYLCGLRTGTSSTDLDGSGVCFGLKLGIKVRLLAQPHKKREISVFLFYFLFKRLDWNQNARNNEDVLSKLKLWLESAKFCESLIKKQPLVKR